MVDPITQRAYQQAYRSGGYTGDFGGGQATAWKQAQGADTISNIENLKKQYLSQYQQQMSPSAPNVANVASLPMLQEPLHQYEKSALMSLGGGAPDAGMEARQLGAQGLSGMLQGTPDLSRFLQMAGDQTGAGVAAVTPEEVEARRNPYAGALKNRLSDEAEKIRAQATAGQGMRGGASFGDTSSGTQLGMVQQEKLRGMGDIDYKTYGDAMGQINAERGRNLAGAGIYGDLASRGANLSETLYGVGSAEREQQLDNTLNQLRSGEYIRGYNEDANRMLATDILAREGDPLARLQNTLNMLPSYGSNVSSGQTGGMANGLQQAGGVATALSGLLGGLS